MSAVPGLASAADSIVVGPDDALWVTLADDPGRVARIAPAGIVTFPGVGGLKRFPVNAQPHGLAAGTQQAPFWFLLAAPFQFAAMSAVGETTAYELEYGRPTSLAAGPDGNLWMTVDGQHGRRDAITRFSPGPPPVETRFSNGLTHRSEPRSITRGPDGALWFVDAAQARLGRITPQGDLSYEPVDAVPTALAAGPLDGLWYAHDNVVRQLSDAGTAYTTPSPVNALALGPDDTLWAAVRGGAVRIAPGASPEFATVESATQGLAIVQGPDERMWMTLDRPPYLVKIAVPPHAHLLTVTSDRIIATIDPHGVLTTATAEAQQPDGAWRALKSIDAGTTRSTQTLDISGLLGPGDHLVRLKLISAGGTVHTGTTRVTIPGPEPTAAPEPTAEPTANPIPTTSATPTPTPPPTPLPNTTPAGSAREGKTVEVKVIRGTASFRAPDESDYTRITGSVVLPLGVVLDTSKGEVALTTEFDGTQQTAAFRGGKFSVTQTRTGITELALAGPLACLSRARKATAAAAKKKKRSLWGRDRGGNYRTRGTSSVATVRGTEWRTEDTCQGTTVYVRSGSVSVWPRSGGRSTLLKAGQRLFNPRPR